MLSINCWFSELASHLLEPPERNSATKTYLLVRKLGLFLTLPKQRIRRSLILAHRDFVDPRDPRMIGLIEELGEKLAVDLVLGEERLDLACKEVSLRVA